MRGEVDHPGVAVAGVGVALALVAGGTYWWFGGLPTSVAPPPADAQPHDVVKTYLKALDGHDCQRAERLWVDQSKDTWCDEVASIDLRHIDAPRSVVEPGSGEYAVVQVRFDVDWRPFQDVSTEEGDLTWSYTLTRPGAGQPWRLFSEGMG